MATAAIPAGKTPISYLQELCTKRGITPQYDLIANEGAVHEPTFIMRVTVGEIISTGKGRYCIEYTQNFIRFTVKPLNFDGHYFLWMSQIAN